MKTKLKTKKRTLQVIILQTPIIKGISNAISTSKTKKTIAKIKNRRQNAWRDLAKGSKPHSYVLSFSRLYVVLTPKIYPNTIKKKEKKNKTNR